MCAARRINGVGTIRLFGEDSGESGETGVRDAVLRAPGGVVGPSAALASSAGRRRIVYRIVLHGWLRDLWTEDRYEHKGAWGKARMHGL